MGDEFKFIITYILMLFKVVALSRIVYDGVETARRCRMRNVPAYVDEDARMTFSS